MNELAKVLEEGFKRGPVMLVVLVVDTRVPGVNVPESFAGTINLKLSFSPRFDVQDLVMNEQGISQTLMFNGKHFPVVIPWAAVLAYHFKDGDYGICFENLPIEIQERLEPAVFYAVFAPLKGQPKPKKPTLRVIH